ncbi:sensor domain-containing diguanylate cyclase [Paenibacillus fonticola]|uniref:sensor domain-containing diguanylate cyclase n=1 Tax=Paenibacillus fonticola TaxID=379896 RepID=UPI0003615837|nr:sensor domain-containing diguanylate cyclase [Paenibacillus fonticola]
MKRMKLSLRYLIVCVALLSFILTLISSLLSGYDTNKQTLIANTLETNRMYAEKLAKTTDGFLQTTLQILSVSAVEIATIMDDEAALLREADRLKMQTRTFNSVVITDPSGKVLATSPQSLDLKGRMLTSPGSKEALEEKRPLISKPYTGITGRLIIFISYPVFDQQHNYLGMVGGTLYLKETNILNEILGEHFYKDGSYVYVVDRDGRIIYHQDQGRINDVVDENPVVRKLMNGEGGAERVINTMNKDMLAGYSYIPTADWGVVSQRETEFTLIPAKEMLKKMVVTSFPFLFVSLIFIIWLSNKIAQPLHKLAYYTENSTEKNQAKYIAKIPAWYYEVIQLKKALVHSLAFLHNRINYSTHQSRTDSLTKLTNRRGMEEHVKKWLEEEKPFSLIMLDIDHFKRVNDTYGHAAGDHVLQFLAMQMAESVEPNHICCRYGGEEFVILLPGTAQHNAVQVAERLRSKMESTVSPCGDIVTVSAGVAAYPDHASDLDALVAKADSSLYEAKKRGRNQIVAFESHNVIQA